MPQNNVVHNINCVHNKLIFMSCYTRDMAVKSKINSYHFMIVGFKLIDNEQPLDENKLFHWMFASIETGQRRLAIDMTWVPRGVVFRIIWKPFSFTPIVVWQSVLARPISYIGGYQGLPSVRRPLWNGLFIFIQSLDLFITATDFQWKEAWQAIQHQRSEIKKNTFMYIFFFTCESGIFLE